MYMSFEITFCAVLAALMLGGCGSAMGHGDTVEDTVSRVDRLELPALEREDYVLEYDGFTSSYNQTTLVPNWVAYQLQESELDGAYDTRSSK
jgi:DNA/RNA endonuclease G (NUC1)